MHEFTMNLYELTHAYSWVKSIAKIDTELEKTRNRVKAIKYVGVHNPGSVQPGNEGFESNRKDLNTKSYCWVQHR